jgi:hypothetical protein
MITQTGIYFFGDRYRNRIFFINPTQINSNLIYTFYSIYEYGKEGKTRISIGTDSVIANNAILLLLVILHQQQPILTNN